MSLSDLDVMGSHESGSEYPTERRLERNDRHPETSSDDEDSSSGDRDTSMTNSDSDSTDSSGSGACSRRQRRVRRRPHLNQDAARVRGLCDVSGAQQPYQYHLTHLTRASQVILPVAQRAAQNQLWQRCRSYSALGG